MSDSCRLPEFFRAAGRWQEGHAVLSGISQSHDLAQRLADSAHFESQPFQ